MGKDSLEKGSEQTTGRQGAGRYNFQRQKPSQVTGAGTRRRGYKTCSKTLKQNETFEM